MNKQLTAGVGADLHLQLHRGMLTGFAQRCERMIMWQICMQLSGML